MKNVRSRLMSMAVLGLALAGSAQAAPHGIFRVGSKTPSAAPKGGGLVYYGGPVIPNAKVYAVFWGSNVAQETQDKIGPFYANILDGAYMDWLSEYDTNLNAVDGRPGTNQHIGRGSFAGSVTIQPVNANKSLQDAEVRQELEAQIAAGKLAPSDENTLYMIYFPSDVSISIEGSGSCSAFCGYHEGFKSKGGSPVYYGVLPACGGLGCGASDPYEALEVVSSHEALEAVTDPFPTPGNQPAYPQAWNTTDGNEVADLCAGSAAAITGRGVTSQVQAEWKNSLMACYNGPWASSFEARAFAAPLVPANAPLLAPLFARPSINFDGR